MERTDENQTATPLELFFDLVFVFALTQVTAYMAHPLDHHVSPWLAMLQGVLLMALLWWAWVGYSWLTNLVRADEGVVRLILMVAMVAMFALSLSIPEAFHDLPGGLSGPWVLLACYLLFRVTHIALFWCYARDDRGLRKQLVKFTPTLLVSTALLAWAATTHDRTLQTALWAIALAGEYLGTVLGGSSGWRLRSVGHFAERHGLMVIIALGESIVAIGIGAEELPVSWPIIAASALGLALASGLWWIYFDITSIHAEHALAEAPDDGHRTAMARDAYSVLHLPLMVGIVLLALGLKKLLGYVGDPEHHALTDPLSTSGLVALYGGVGLYLVGHIAFKLRTTRILSIPRTVAVVVLAGLLAGLWSAPALAQLGGVVALVWLLIVFETWTYSEQRHEVRHAGHGHQMHEVSDADLPDVEDGPSLG
jgi:low temperature requirement protein LtrA